MADRPNDPKVPETLGACDYALRPWAALATFPQAFPPTKMKALMVTTADVGLNALTLAPSQRKNAKRECGREVELFVPRKRERHLPIK
jgi:hypothetical protein